MDEKLLNLPWEIQLALGSGYVAYALAYLGIKDHHKPVDTAFRTIAFGLCATAVLTLIPPSYGAWRVAAAISAAIIGGAIWRYCVADGVQWLVRKTNLSWSDETPSAWARITTHNRRTYVSQLSIQLDDDSWVFCDNTSLFNNSPFGPCVLGPDGDVALYVTHKCGPGPDSEIIAVSDVRDRFHGDSLTYISAARIRRISFRMLRSTNGSEAAEAEHPAAAPAEP
jgi:hypothetical protein